MTEIENTKEKIKEKVEKALKEKAFNPKAINEIELGNSPEILELFDKCTLNCHYCGFKTKDGFCLQKDRCSYKLSEKYFEKPEDSTVEVILKLLQKRTLKISEILAITPLNELRTIREFINGKLVIKNYIVDSKGYIFDLNNLRLIAKPLKPNKPNLSLEFKED